MIFRRRRNLRREFMSLGKKRFWRRHGRSPRFDVSKLGYVIPLLLSDIGSRATIFRSAIYAVLGACTIGGLLLGIALGAESLLARYIVSYPWYGHIELKPDSPVAAFPALAVQVLAALLGFYLATMGIVLGNSYRDVSELVRDIILKNTRLRHYMELVGMTIGVGFAIVLLQSFEIISIGYLTVGLYAILVLVSGWALGTLAISAFTLFNPIRLGNEPLHRLYRAIDRLDSGGLTRDDAALRASMLDADRALRALAELIQLTETRPAVSRDGLAKMVNSLLKELCIYSHKKQSIPPTSGWFPREISYPRWVESDNSAMSRALDTSTPLQESYEPSTDWLERRVAEIASAALRACELTDDREAALRITRRIVSTAQALAASYRFDEAVTFVTIIAGRCGAIDQDNPTGHFVLAEQPLISAALLKGFNEAAASWLCEIRRAVDDTKWDNTDTREVRIKSPVRVWKAVYILLQQIQSEHAIEGRRITPDWYLRSILAEESIIALREFVDRVSGLLRRDDWREFPEGMTPESRVAMGVQALQMLSRAESLSESIPQPMAALNELRSGREAMSIPEAYGLAESIEVVRSSSLRQLGQALSELSPEYSKTDPDYFGQALFALMHHGEQAMVDGNEELLGDLFPRILAAAPRLFGHLLTTYRPPTYELSLWVYNPIIYILELSGLSIIYETIRDDHSAEPVRSAWQSWMSRVDNRGEFVAQILNTLEAVDSIYMPMSQMRVIWEGRAARKIVEAGYAHPEYDPSTDRPEWDAPALIKVLSVSSSLPSLLFRPMHCIRGRSDWTT